MAEEKYVEYAGESLRKRRGPLMWCVDMLLTLATLGVGIVVPIIFVVPYVAPAKMGIFAVLALAAPAFYVVTVLLALYWIIRWRLGRAGWMLVLVVAGLFRMPLFWKPQLGREYEEKRYDRTTFKVMTFNVRNFYDMEGGSSVDRVVALIDSLRPDIVCLQEFNRRLAGRSERFAALTDKYEVAHFGLGEEAEVRQMILSRSRMLRSGLVLASGASVWADVKVGDDTVRVFNSHLHSTAIKAADNDYITGHGFIGDTARETKFRSIAGRLRHTAALRAVQVDSIVGAMREARARRIVCGDFNDTPMSYAYRSMSRGLRDAFAECGEGYSYTYRGFFDMLRIDYVLATPHYGVLSYEVPEADCSDHYPVVVRLKPLAGVD
ncbi:MAG: endonuclease/exonuclease/phosphatase family protein [Alistipes sp.]|nr:endonuclease/exonuclease/phosphatase family protein [Alistipes sp.]